MMNKGNRINIKPLVIFTFLIWASIFTGKVFAQFGLGGPAHVHARLLSEVNSVQPGADIWLAVEAKMDKGWHIYWRNVGDTGLETAVEWTLPQGFSAGALQWPYPERIVEDPLVVYGYHGTKYFLTQIHVSRNVKVNRPVTIKAKLSWLVCAEVCVPGDTTMTIELPIKNTVPETDTRYAQLFSDARHQLPIKPGDWKIEAAVEGDKLLIQAVPPAWFKGELGSVTFFPYQANVIQNAGKASMEKKGPAYRLSLPLAEQDAVIPDTLKGILVADHGWRGENSEKAVEIILPLQKELSSLPGGGAGKIWLAFLFAFLGGIILNLMPCVLPVLSIKIMSFVKQAHDEHVQPWKHGLIFTLGVLVAFWALAGLLLILKAGGAHLGWGFQLQSPTFIIIVAAFIFLFGLSMLGVFEIGASLTTVGGAAQKYHGMMSSFVSGIIATIVATPCTAPFMGSALGFALTQPNWVALSVFTFLGLGMAAPFFILSSIPKLLKYVPKPGRWMESLEQFMGFLLVGTVVWLVWVLGVQAGINAVTLVLFDLFLTAVGAWIYGRWGNLAMPKKTRILAWLMALVIVVGSNGYVLANIDSYTVSPQQTVGKGEGLHWQPFSEEKVAELTASGKPVFVDFTAAWCLSCQVNEQVAFGSEEVQKKFAELGITALKADWTSRDEKIGKALAKFGRNSVPLYVLYSGKQGDKPQLLPEIITPGIVLDALKSVE